MNTTTCSMEIVDSIVNEAKGLFTDLSIIDLKNHLTSHKYFLGLKLGYSPSWSQTIMDYEQEIFCPIVHEIFSWNFDIAFPKTKKEVLYFQFCTHLYYLRLINPKTSIKEASIDFCHIYGKNKKGKMLVNLLTKIS